MELQSEEAKALARAKRDAAMAEARRVRAAYAKLFKTPNGKIVLADLKRRYLQIDPTADPIVMAQKVGAHAMLVDIIKQTEPLPENDNGQ